MHDPLRPPFWPRAGSIVIGSILETDAARTLATLATLAATPGAPGLVELRADHLRPNEVEHVVRESARPMLVAVRRPCDGGAFAGSEEERRALLERALEAGAAIDVEWDGSAASLATRPGVGDRVVVSHHGGPCRIDPLRDVVRQMASRPGLRLKLVPEASAIDEVLALRTLLAEAAGSGLRLAAFATGASGVLSRILGPAWGSWATYGAIAPGRETAAGQLTVDDLSDVYDVLAIRGTTRLFGLLGATVSRSPSPAMHAKGYDEAGVDARYLPIETDDLERGIGAARDLGIEAVGVTTPFKEELSARCRPDDDVAAAAGAVNTVHIGAVLRGSNTDGPAVVERISRHLDPRGARVAILGAGGTARGCGVALSRAGAEVALFGRSPERVGRAARAIGARAGTIDDLADLAWDVLIHATPQGGDGTRFVAPESLSGRLVVDAVYAPRATALVRDARARGIATIDGVELLAAQGVLQFERMTGRAVRYETLHVAATRWLARRGA